MDVKECRWDLRLATRICTLIGTQLHFLTVGKRADHFPCVSPQCIETLRSTKICFIAWVSTLSTTLRNLNGLFSLMWSHHQSYRQIIKSLSALRGNGNDHHSQHRFLSPPQPPPPPPTAALAPLFHFQISSISSSYSAKHPVFPSSFQYPKPHLSTYSPTPHTTLGASTPPPQSTQTF